MIVMALIISATVQISMYLGKDQGAKIEREKITKEQGHKEEIKREVSSESGNENK